MVGQIGAGGEDDALWCDSAPFGFQEKIALCGVVAFEQPEHAAVDLAQKPAPDVEHVRGYLVAAVEAAKHEALFRQPDFATGRSTFADAFF